MKKYKPISTAVGILAGIAMVSIVTFAGEPSKTSSDSGEQTCKSCTTKTSPASFNQVVSDPVKISLDETPQDRFNQVLNKIEDDLIRTGTSQDGFNHVNLESIVLEIPNQPRREWSFDKEGYVSTYTEGADAIQFERQGTPLYGFKIKSPSNGYNDFTQIFDVDLDSYGNIISATWIPTGETRTYPTILPVDIASEDRLFSLNSFTVTTQTLNKAEKKCIQQCRDSWEDAIRANDLELKKCARVVNDKLINCMVFGVTAGAIGGTAIPGLGNAIGAILGGGVAALGCSWVAATEIRSCKINHKNTAQYNYDSYKACRERCIRDN